MAKDPTKVLLPVKGIARVFGLKPENIRAEADAGKLPHTRVGDEYLFNLAAVEAALLERAGATHPADPADKLGGKP
jgi:excisionase family DNA binding protein